MVSLREPTLLPTPAVVGDAELVARALAGDQWSREVLYRRHGGYLLGMTTRLLRNRGDAEEVVQDTFVLGLSRLSSLREPAALRAWLAQIAVSLVGRRLRRARLLRFLGLDRGEEGAGLGDLASSELAVDDRADLALLDRALGRLRPDVRIAWMLRRVEGLALGDVASVCGCSLATTKRRIAEADLCVGRFANIGEVAP